MTVNPMITSSYWQSEFLASVEDMARGKDLRDIFKAAGCREGWIQAELYLRHRNRVHVNTIPIADGTKADLSADLTLDSEENVRRCGDRPMVAEVKVLAASFQWKTISGGAIRPFRDMPCAKGRRRITRSNAKALCRGSWGLIPDYIRLLNARRLPACTEKLLILVELVECDDECDRIGRDLRCIDFQSKSFKRRRLGKWGLVRIWSL